MNPDLDKHPSGEHMQNSGKVSFLKTWSVRVRSSKAIYLHRCGGALSKRNLEMVSTAAGTGTDRLTRRPPRVIKKDEAEAWHGEVYLISRNVSVLFQVFHSDGCPGLLQKVLFLDN